MFPEHQFQPVENPGWVRKIICLYFAVDFEEVKPRSSVVGTSTLPAEKEPQTSSSDAQMLFLDADCLPLVDPAVLFEDPEYVKHGSLFWPDYQEAYGEVVGLVPPCRQIFN